MTSTTRSRSATARWGLAIGDVCGKGVDAAALTALARHTVRAAAVEGHSPSDVLRALNRAVLAEARLGQFLTAIFARLQVRPGGGFELRWPAAGTRRRCCSTRDGSDQAARVRRARCSGVLDDPNVADVDGRSRRPGDALLLYTDGLTEAGAPSAR